MNIIFFGRRESDFDHFAPLAFFLKKKTSLKITFTDIFMDPTMTEYEKDKRFLGFQFASVKSLEDIL